MARITRMTTLIVLPGLDGTGRLHSAFVAEVGPAFESVGVLSYPTDAFLDYPALEQLVRDALPKTGAFVLLGESFSGPIALSIAAAPPPNLIGLVLSTTFCRSPVPLLSPLARLMRYIPARRVPISLLSPLLLGRWQTPALRRSLKQTLSTVSPDVLKRRASAAMRIDVAPVLGGIKVAVLSLHAGQDRLLGTSAAHALESKIPHMKTVLVAGPHLLLQTAPRACAQAIRDFVEGLVVPANSAAGAGSTECC